MSIGEAIKRFRITKKMSRKKLGDLIGKSQHSIKKYELGEVTPSLEVIEDISKALDIEKWDILRGLKEGKPRGSYKEEAINNMIDDFIEFSKGFGFDIFEYHDNNYIISSPNSDNELMITKNELLEIRDKVMAYSKFTLDYSFEKLNNDEHKSPLGEVFIVEEE